MASGLAIAGMQPLSTVDWPGKLVATVYLQGCPWTCPYCHNFEIIDPKVPGVLPWEEVTALLRRRQGLLDGVVFSGGEATRQPELIDAAREVKELGFLVGLHTSGAYPGTFSRLLDEGLLDWVGIDVKALPEDYAEVAGPAVSAQKNQVSLQKLLDSGVDYEVRFTLWQGGLDYAEKVAAWCKHHGVENFVLQKLSTQNLPPGFNPAAEVTGWKPAVGEAMLEKIGFASAVVRH